jgi:hypothetical protein
VTFRNKLSFYGEELLAHAQPVSWRTTPYRLSATAYSKIFSTFSLSRGRLLHPQSENAPFIYLHTGLNLKFVAHNTRIRPGVKFLTADLETFNTAFVGMCMICPHTTFHVTKCIGSLFITMKPKAEYEFHAFIVLLPYIKKI